MPTESVLSVASRRPPVAMRQDNGETKSAKRASFLEDTSDLTVPLLLTEVLETFDLAGVGLAIADLAGRLLLVNRMAEKILASRDGLELTAARILCTVRGKGSVAYGLFDQLRDAKVDEAEEKERITILAVPRPSGRRPLTVLVRFAEVLPDRSNASSPSTFVFIVDPELPMKGMESHLRHVYKLTAAETELATLLMQGNDLRECCRRMGIRRSTAASHLRQLFNKTQARTQGQLVSVLFRRFGLLSSLLSPSGTGSAGDRTTASDPPLLDRRPSSETVVDSFIRT